MRITITDGRRQTIEKTFKFSTKFKRFWELRKLKKQHPEARILEEGFTAIGYDGNGYYWTKVQYKA